MTYEDQRDEILDSSQDEHDPEVMNPPAEFIVVVLHHIYNIYLKEFEDKKNDLSPEEREQIKVEDIFDEFDK